MTLEELKAPEEVVKTAKPTPGPWTVVVPMHPLRGFTHAITAPTGAIAWTFPPGDDLALAEANARLIAAAPDLFAACQLAYLAIELYGGQSVVLDEAFGHLKAAIAKAKGE